MRLFTPSLIIPTVYDLPMEWLRERSVRAVISDLDNTLVPWRDYKVAQELCDWFTHLHEEGFRTVILTNARPSPTIKELSKQLGTKLVIGARKPVQRFFREALRKVEVLPGQACVIGDQVFTDILGGNIMGCHTVLVEKLGSREFFGTRITRILERVILRHLAKKTPEP